MFDAIVSKITDVVRAAVQAVTRCTPPWLVPALILALLLVRW